MWSDVKECSGAEVYRNKSDPQQRNSRFNKVLARKFGVLAAKMGNEVAKVYTHPELQHL